VTKNNWLVAISNHNKLTLDFKEKLNWPLTVAQRRLEQQIANQKIPRVCSQCGKTFTLKDNDPNECGRHEYNFLIREDQYQELSKMLENNQKAFEQVPRYTKKYVMKKVSEKTVPVEQFKWGCCGKGLREPGEIPCKHAT